MKELRVIFIGTHLMLLFMVNVSAQIFYPADTIVSTITYDFSGGSFQSFGCVGLDPTFWLDEFDDTVRIEFTNAQTDPAVRFWGMNPDDSAKININGLSYPLNSTTAHYTPKVICNVAGSPGPEGIAFSNDKVHGIPSGNFSFQDIYIDTSNVTHIEIIGHGGTGWGFAGVVVLEPLSNYSEQSLSPNQIQLFPNPSNGTVIISSTQIDQFKVRIVNMIGVLVHQTTVSTEHILDLSFLDKGQYFAICSNNKFLDTKKLVLR